MLLDMTKAGFNPTASIYSFLATTYALALKENNCRKHIKLAEARAKVEEKEASPSNEKDRLFLKTRQNEIESEIFRVKQTMALPKHLRRPLRAAKSEDEAPPTGLTLVYTPK